jgi:hypothetical protein
MKQNKIALTTAPALKFEDVKWPLVFEQEDFKTMGLCNRHVQIDNSGRDWYGMPLIVDEQAAPVQGPPYVMKFTEWGEKTLNELLWQYEYVRKGEYATAEVLSYRWYLEACAVATPARVPLSREQYFYQRVIRHIRAGVLPSPRIARYYIVHETSEQYAARDAAAEAKGERYATNLERFAQLDFFGRVLFTLQGLIRSQRQELYFKRLLASAENREKLAKVERQRESQLHWLPIDRQREEERLATLRARRAGQPTPLVEIIQHSLFQEVA